MQHPRDPRQYLTLRCQPFMLLPTANYGDVRVTGASFSFDPFMDLAFLFEGGWQS